MDLQTQRALAHPKRRAILGYLMQKTGKGAGECELADFLDMAIAKVRYHLTVLRDADLIADDPEAGTGGRYLAAALATE